MALVVVADLAGALHRSAVDLEAPYCMALVPPVAVAVADDTDGARGRNDSEVEDAERVVDTGKAWGSRNAAVVSEVVAAAAGAGNIADAAADILA